MKALILAAGLGTRLRPLTNFVPKALLPVFGVPIIERNIVQLRDQGIREFLVNLHHMPRQILQRLKDGSSLGVRVHYSLEPTLLGTAGAIKKLEGQLREAPFLVVNADTFRPLRLKALVSTHETKQGLVTLLLQENKDLAPERSITLNQAGEVVAFLDMFQDKLQQGSRRCDFLGVQVMEPEVLSMIPEDRPWEVHRLYLRLLESGKGILGHCEGGYWKDLGTLAAYLQIHLDALDGKGPVTIPGEQVKTGVWIASDATMAPDVKLVAPVFVDSFARIDSGACVGPYTVVGRNCWIGSGARVKESILWEEARIEPGATVSKSLISPEFKQRWPQTSVGRARLRC